MPLQNEFSNIVLITHALFRELYVAYLQFNKNRCKKTVTELLDLGVICPSTSPYDMVLAPQKDGKPRLSVDYKALNKKTFQLISQTLEVIP